MGATRDFLRPQDELREARILAGKRIRKLNFGGRDDPVLPVLRKGSAGIANLRRITSRIEVSPAQTPTEGQHLKLSGRKK